MTDGSRYPLRRKTRRQEGETPFIPEAGSDVGMQLLGLDLQGPASDAPFPISSSWKRAALELPVVICSSEHAPLSAFGEL